MTCIYPTQDHLLKGKWHGWKDFDNLHCSKGGRILVLWNQKEKQEIIEYAIVTIKFVVQYSLASFLFFFFFSAVFCESLDEIKPQY